MDRNELAEKAIAAGDNGGADAIFAYIDNFINEHPDSSDGYFVRSELYAEKGDFQKALYDSEKALKINPFDDALYDSRGRIYVKSGSGLDKALKDFDKAIELNPKSSSAYTNRANVYLKMRDAQKAIDDCTMAIDISKSEHDESAEPYINRGIAYANTGKHREALDDFTNAISLEPENAETFAKRGGTNIQLGNTQEAIRDFEESLRIDPHHRTAELVRKGLEQLKNGKSGNVLSNYPKIAELARDGLECLKNDEISCSRVALLILSAIGFIIGTIIGAGSRNTFAGIWLGIGGGVALSSLLNASLILDMFKTEQEKKGTIEALKFTFLGSAIWFFIYMIAGPIGFVIRFLRTW